MSHVWAEFGKGIDGNTKELKTSLLPIRRHSRDDEGSGSLLGDAALAVTEAHEDPSRFSAEDEKESILGLPSSQPSSPGETPWITLRIWNRIYALDRRSFRIISKRTVKSLLLTWKVGRESNTTYMKLDSEPRY